MKHTDTNGIKTSIIIALFASFTLGIFAPLEMYFVNVAEFWFDLEDLAKPILIQFATIFSTVYLFSRLAHLLGNFIEIIVNCIFMFIVTLLYVQGNFMQIDYGNLGDETIDFSEFNDVGIFNSIGWIGLLTILIMLVILKKYEQFTRIYRIVMICILLVQTITLLIVGASSNAYTQKNNYIATTEDFVNYSEDDNIIVIVSDTFDSRILTDILQSDPVNQEKCKNILENFTFYKNTTCDYNLTDFSIPQIITGEKYLNQSTYGDYCNEAYSKSPWLNRLKSEDWDINIYTTVTLPQGEVAKDIKNWHKIDYKISEPVGFILAYDQLLAFRYMPHYLKEFFYYKSDLIEEYSEINTIDGNSPKEGNYQYTWENAFFAQSIGYIDTRNSKKTVHFIHMKGLHSFRDMDYNFNNIEINDEDDEMLPEDTAKILLSLYEGYFKRLKELDIYDNSTIIIMADHGLSSYALEFVNQNALLLVKGKNEKHDFIISDTPISYDNLQRGFSNLMDGKTGDKVFDIKDGENDIRYVYRTIFEGALNTWSKSATFIEYSTEYPSYESVKARRTGNEY